MAKFDAEVIFSEPFKVPEAIAALGRAGFDVEVLDWDSRTSRIGSEIVLTDDAVLVLHQVNQQIEHWGST